MAQAPTWLKQGYIRMYDDETFYELSVVVNEEIYMVGMYSRGIVKVVNFNLNWHHGLGINIVLNPMKITKLVMFEWGNLGSTNAYVYNDHILLFNRGNRDFPRRLVKINTITRRIKDIRLDDSCFVNFWDKYERVVGECVGNDTLYVILRYELRNEKHWRIASVNLQTMENQKPGRNLSPEVSEIKTLTAIFEGKDVICFCDQEPFVLVYGTDDERWKKVENYKIPSRYLVSKKRVFENGEWSVEKRVDGESYENWKYNYKSINMDWLEDLPCYPANLHSFYYRLVDFCYFKGNIFGFKNSYNSFIRDTHHDENIIRLGFETDKILEVWCLDLEPEWKIHPSLITTLRSDSVPKKLPNILRGKTSR
ncbi:hypothetical protein CHUAL_007854 [Chamberlinius hualienensis]